MRKIILIWLLLIGSLFGVEYEWVEVQTTDTPDKRYGHAGFTINETFYIFGGMVTPNRSRSNDAPDNDLHEFSEGNDGWKEVADVNPPPARSGTSVAVSGGEAVLFGGKGTDANTYLRDIWKYTPTAKTWSELSTTGTIPSNRAGHSSAVVGNRFYVFGGHERFDSSGHQVDRLNNDFYYLDLTTNDWSFVSAMGDKPTPREGAVLVVDDNQLYLFGGKSDTEYFNDLFKYDPPSNQWTKFVTTGTPPTPRSGAVGHVENGELHIAGGADNSESSKERSKLNLQTLKWSAQTNLPSGVTESVIGESGGEKIMFGGKGERFESTQKTFKRQVKEEEPSKVTGKNSTPGKALKVGDPVSAASGAYHFSLPLLSLGGMMNMDFTLHYNQEFDNAWTTLIKLFPTHDDPKKGETHPFWFSPMGFLSKEGDFIHAKLSSGDQIGFKADGLAWVLEESSSDGRSDNGNPTPYSLKTGDDDTLFLQDPSGLVYYFKHVAGDTGDYLLYYVFDRTGNQLKYSYDLGTAGKAYIAKIEDTKGRVLDFTYSAIGADMYLSKVSDTTDVANPREITFTYESNAADQNNQTALRSITDARENSYTFSYQIVQDSANIYLDNISKLTHPKGNAHVENQFNEVSYTADDGVTHQEVKVTSQTNPFGDESTLSYQNSPYKTTLTYPDGEREDYAHSSSNAPTKELVDSDGNSIIFDINAHNQVTGVTDRFGDTTTIAYHEQSGKIASVTNTKGDILSYSYTPQDQTFSDPEDNTKNATFTFYNQTRVDYPDGTYAEHTYDANGSLLTHKNQKGDISNFTYNASGQLIQSTNPQNGKTTYTYNADNTLASSTDDDIGITTYAYDSYRRLIQITNPDTTTKQIAYNPNSQITSITDERGKVTTYEYDTNGNLIKTTDANNKAANLGFNAMDKVNQTTDRVGNQKSFAYDSRDRVTTITDANGDVTTYGYDAKSNIESITNANGETTSLEWDVEKLLTSVTTPLGRVTAYERDQLGNIIKTTNPLGDERSFERDSMQRITKQSDPLARERSFTYSETGEIKTITNPTIGTVNFSCTSLGLLSQITDFEGKNWLLGYTNMGRLSQITDPLNSIWNYSYNDNTQMNQITYPDASTQTITHDGSGNIIRRLFSDGTDLEFGYDNLNRLTQASGIAFAYNDNGQITNTTNPGHSFGAAYDAVGNIASTTYNNGAFSVNYTYDSAKRLTAVEDTLTNSSVTFEYDDDGRVTNINRSNNNNTEKTVDDASQITEIKYKDHCIKYEYNEAGEVTKATYDLPLNPAALLINQTNNFTHNDASQITNAGYAHDSRGRVTQREGETLTWSADTRLTSSPTATMTYNALGDLRTRTKGAEHTHYYYNYALNLHPMVAEMDENSGTWNRYYVLAPNGNLLYMIDANDGNRVYFYHYDKMGNTLFLTDNSGAISDKYAYTPYGKLLAHEGTNTQPFTFGGEYQAREEGDNLYQMRARYYDAKSARFLSKEPLWPMTKEGGKVLNPYQYAVQNPLMFVDKTGLEVKLLADLRSDGTKINSIGDALNAMAKMQYIFQQALGDERGLLTIKALMGDRHAEKKLAKIKEKEFQELAIVVKKASEERRKVEDAEIAEIAKEKKAYEARCTRIKGLQTEACNLLNRYETTGDKKYLNEAKEVNFRAEELYYQ